MSESSLEFVLADEDATAALGAALARAYSTARGGAVLFLHGELGAGKTTCVRGLLRALGVEGSVRSPTYTLVETYRLRGFTCIHVDLYRLQRPADVEDLGLRDYLDAECLLLAEWPEKGATALPTADIESTLAYAENPAGAACRRARLIASTTRGQRLLDLLSHDTSFTAYVSNLT